MFPDEFLSLWIALRALTGGSRHCSGDVNRPDQFPHLEQVFQSPQQRVRNIPTPFGGVASVATILVSRTNHVVSVAAIKRIHTWHDDSER
jgi:hypothetical protein